MREGLDRQITETLSEVVFLSNFCLDQIFNFSLKLMFDSGISEQFLNHSTLNSASEMSIICVDIPALVLLLPSAALIA